MAIIDTKPAAYKGVSFLAITSQIDGGRKDVLFEFPNSDKQVVEDLGLRPRSYSMRIVIPHENYIEQRDNLLRALEDGEKGPLEHPFYGRVEDIVVRSFVINERLSDLGRAELSIEFAISNDVGVPQKSTNAISEASTQVSICSASITEDIASDFDADEGFFGNFQDAQDLVGGAVDAFNEVTAFASTITTEINQYAANINAFTAEVNQLISIPQDLANSVQNIFSSVDGLFSSVEATFDAFANPTFFDFGDNDSKVHQTTHGRVQRAQNRDVFNQAMQSFAVSYAYLNAAQVEFETVEDIDAVNSILEDQFNKIQSSQGVSEPGLATPANTIKGVSNSTLTAIADLRIIVNNLLDAKRTEAKKVITISTKQMPMAVLAYRYYGNTELTDTLLELNSIKGAGFIKGDIRILTE